MNWKVNFGMANEREDVEMKSNWKKWIDLIYHKYPDMLSFDIDALVDKKGNEYILEINGSCQGFAPEHGDQDLIHMRNLCMRKMESICNIEILEEKDDEMKKLFNDKIDIKEIKDDEKEIKIINLKNYCSDLQKELNYVKNKLNEIKKNYKLLEENKNKNNHFNIIFFIFGILFIVFAYIKYKL